MFTWYEMEIEIASPDLWMIVSMNQWRKHLREHWRGGHIPNFYAYPHRVAHELSHMIVCEEHQLLIPGWGYPFFSDANPLRMSTESFTAEIKTCALERAMWASSEKNPSKAIDLSWNLVADAVTVSNNSPETKKILHQRIDQCNRARMIDWLGQWNRNTVLDEITRRHSLVRKQLIAG